MVITRRIEVFICEDNKEQRRAYYDKLYAIKNIARDAANAATSHLFMLDHSVPYLDEQSRQAIQFVGTKGTPSSRQNVAYCLMSNLFKEKMPGVMDMLSNLSQMIRKNYEEDKKQGMWKRSLRSYKDNLPIPYQKKSFRNFGFRTYTDGEGNEKEGCFFTISDIPFQMRFGRDRSNNRIIIERVLNGEYKMCTSSLQVDGKKVFLLLCVDVPTKEAELNPKKTLYTMLSFVYPIVCTTDQSVSFAGEQADINVYHSIGTKEEFLYRRRQIQEAVKRCQVKNRYSAGGKGRRKKCKAIDRWHEKEKNYVDTKLHTYSKMLVDYAVKMNCGQIVLISQKEREDEAKKDKYILRNWSYYGLKEKIAYKCKMCGIKLIEKQAEGETPKEFEV